MPRRDVPELDQTPRPTMPAMPNLAEPHQNAPRRACHA